MTNEANEEHAKLLVRLFDAAVEWEDDDMPKEVALLAEDAGVDTQTIKRALELSNRYGRVDD